ncbi:MAG TPA: helix-turn-helix domain-containing protein [Nevskia sp.]|jgi:DNA-binding HxlR family transcriptional regulator|nr:helix-turn-helix domain-containing protein [Nevskia sp.]
MSLPEQDVFDDRRLGRVARDLLDRVGDRWSALVIYVLHERPLRFSELKTRIDEFGPKRLGRTEISHKMLAEVLRELRRDGLIVHAGASGHAEYALTPLGRSFWGPMMAIHNWTQEHLDELERARRAFDEAEMS